MILTKKLYNNTIYKKIFSLFLIVLITFTMFFTRYEETHALATTAVVTVDTATVFALSVLVLGCGYAVKDAVDDGNIQSLNFENIGRSMNTVSSQASNMMKKGSDSVKSLYNKISTSVSNMAGDVKTITLNYTKDEINSLKTILNTIKTNSTMSTSYFTNSYNQYNSPIVSKSFQNYGKRTLYFNQMYLPSCSTASVVASVLNTYYTTDTDYNSIDYLCPTSYSNISGDEEFSLNSTTKYIWRMVGSTDTTSTYNLYSSINNVETLLDTQIYDLGKSPFLYLINTWGNTGASPDSYLNGRMYLLYKDNLNQMKSISTLDNYITTESSITNSQYIIENGLADVVSPSSTETDKTLTFTVPLSTTVLGKLTNETTKTGTIPLTTTDGITTIGTITDTTTDTETDTTDTEISKSITQTSTQTLSKLTELFVPSVLPNTFNQLLEMGTGDTEPPKFSVNINKILKITSVFGPNIDTEINSRFDDKETVIFDFSIFNNWKFLNQPLLLYFRGIIGCLIVFGTIISIRNRIFPSNVSNNM